MTKDTHAEAMGRFKQAEDLYSTARQEALDDLHFVNGEQWDVMESTNQTQLTVNLVASFLRQVTNEAKQNKPAIQVSPIAAGASEDVADIYAGLIRSIEQNSDATSAYGLAFWYAAAMGEGYILIDREYVSDTSFDQELFIRGCENPFKVFLDTNCGCLDGSDAEWGFIITDMAKDEYKMKFPESKLTESLAAPFSYTNFGDWVRTDTVRLARYFVKERKKVNLHLVVSSQGTQFTTTEPVDKLLGQPGETFTLISSRPSWETTVMEYLMDGTDILDSTEWPGKNIPIIRVVGDRYYVGDKLITHGAVRMAKDPQRQYNFHTSVQTDMIDMAPKTPFIGATGQFANNPEKWANANTENYGFLDYTPVYGQSGQPLPPPQRISAMDGGLFGAVSQSRQQSLEDLKLVFGVQDASLGRQGNEISGVAILARKEQAGVSNYHYYDNLVASIKYVGRQLLDLIPKLYSNERTVRIVKPSQETQLVLLNSPENNYRYTMEEASKYDVVIDTGPAYSTRRKEAAESMLAMTAAFPESLKFMGDLMVQSMDWPMAKEVAARFKATIPPEVLAATGESTPGQDLAPAEQVQQLQQKMQKQEIELEEAKAKLSIAESETSMKLVQLDMENEQKMSTLDHQRDVAAIEAEIKMIELDLKRKELELKEKELGIKAALGANTVLGSAPVITNVEPGGDTLDADIGGKIG
jgi:hypothetical protein